MKTYGTSQRTKPELAEQLRAFSKLPANYAYRHFLEALKDYLEDSVEEPLYNALNTLYDDTLEICNVVHKLLTDLKKERPDCSEELQKIIDELQVE